MTHKNDLIGPSFEAEHHQNGNGLARLEASSGLTKLEYFAAMAMQGLLSGNPLRPGIDMKLLSNDSVRMAKFLIEELNKQQS